MCEQCDANLNPLDFERKKLAQWALEHPMPCIVCKTLPVVGAGTWIADEKHYLAVGAKNADRIFVFSLCEVHVEPIAANETLIMKAIVRMVRHGNSEAV